MVADGPYVEYQFGLPSCHFDSAPGRMSMSPTHGAASFRGSAHFMSGKAITSRMEGESVSSMTCMWGYEGSNRERVLGWRGQHGRALGLDQAAGALHPM